MAPRVKSGRRFALIMPWTVSHPAAVLPLSRWTPRPFDFAALVVGSMTPDLGYYINCSALAEYDHTFLGSLVAGLPSGLFLLLVFYLVRRPVCNLLPSPHRQALLPLCGPVPREIGRWALIVVALLIGIWSHLAWDGFTHDDGFFVQHLKFMQRTVFRSGADTVSLPLFLQLLSTLVGFVILVVAYFLWLKKQQQIVSVEPREEAWRYLFWFAVGCVTALCAVALAVAVSWEKNGYLFGRSVVFHIAVYLLEVGLPLLLFSATLVNWQKTAGR